jgi:hypothetical protein
MVEPRVTRLPNNFRWPGGHHIALIFNIAYEAWSQGKAPGIGPMGNPLPAGAFDANALSWGNYGSRTGIERLLRTLDRHRGAGKRHGQRSSRGARSRSGAGHCRSEP